MTTSEIARRLGSRGGLSRARRLSAQRLTEIARMGARARADSLRLAGAIRNNLDYVGAVQRLSRGQAVRAESIVSGTLPGIYDGENHDRPAAAGFHRGRR